VGVAKRIMGMADSGYTLWSVYENGGGIIFPFTDSNILQRPVARGAYWGYFSAMFAVHHILTRWQVYIY
jgi:hypothetical protein